MGGRKGKQQGAVGIDFKPGLRTEYVEKVLSPAISPNA